VYFRKGKPDTEGKRKCVEIIPVQISRKMDDRFIGKRLDAHFRPCHGEWLGDEDISELNKFPEKRLLTRHKDGLCPACQLFGTDSYKGRVRFGFATLEGAPVWAKLDSPEVMLPILEKPRPTWSIPKPTQLEPDARIVPGRKFYVHHHGYKDILEGMHPVTQEPIEKSINNRTVKPLGEGNSFTFDIHFENLEPHELGLLIYSIQLEKGLAHKMGMAKAMGFGSIEIDINSLSMKKNNASHKEKSINEWVQLGKEKVSEWLNENWEKSNYIQKLKQLLYYPESQPKVFYPPLEKIESKQQIPSYKELKETNSDKREDVLQARIKSLQTPLGHLMFRKIRECHLVMI
jgi:hypothetical protein